MNNEDRKRIKQWGLRWATRAFIAAGLSAVVFLFNPAGAVRDIAVALIWFGCGIILPIGAYAEEFL